MIRHLSEFNKYLEEMVGSSYSSGSEDERQPCLAEQDSVSSYGSVPEVGDGCEAGAGEGEHCQARTGEQCQAGAEAGGGRAWLVVAASFFCLCILDGICYTFGVFLEPLMEELGLGRGAVSVAGGLQIGSSSLVSLLAARLVTQYGTRPVCVWGALLAGAGLGVASLARDLPSLLASFSLVAGAGLGLVYIPAVVAVAEHFSQRRRQALALGVCVCGSGVGTFLLAPLLQFLLDTLGWRSTFLAMAGLCLACAGCGGVMTPPPGGRPAPACTPRPVHRSWLRSSLALLLSEQLLASPAFLPFSLIALADCIASFALYIPFTFLPDEAVGSAGLARADATFLLATMGLSSAVGRVLAGLLCDLSCCRPLPLTAAVTAVAALPLLAFPAVSSYPAYLALSSTFGCLTGVWISSCGPLLVRLLGLPLLSPAFGVITAAQGLAALTGPALAGAAVDWAGDRGLALHISGAAMLLAAAIYSIVWGQLFRQDVKRRSGTQSYSHL